MKPNKKTFINIANLINQHQSGKKCSKKQYNLKSRPQSQQNVYENIGYHHQKQNFNSTLNVNNRKVSLKLDCNDYSEKEPSIFANTRRSSPTRQNTIFDDKIEKEKHKEQLQHNSKKLKEFETLMVSDKMFIDPDRWQNFIQRSKKDSKFHKALSAFLYSYFIQNYQ